MNKDFLCALPDELILHILYFMDPISVGQCRSVNKRLSRLAYDKVLLKKFPHVIVHREVYFQEEAYLSKGVFLELMKRNTNDISWLVRRTTAIMRECQMDSMSWSLLTYAANDAAWKAAWEAACAARYAAGYAAGSAAWSAARNAAWSAAWSAAGNAGYAGYAAWNALVVTGDDIIEMVHVLGITDPRNVGEKCYQIAECKSLLAINKEFCLTIMAITEKYNLPKSIQIPKEKLAELRDNPWIQQYVELYPGHST